MKDSKWCSIHRTLCSGEIRTDRENYKFWKETAIHGTYDKVTTTEIINLVKNIWKKTTTDVSLMNYINFSKEKMKIIHC